MQRLARLFLCGLFLVGVGLVVRADDEWDDHREQFGLLAFEVLSAPDKVEVFRIDPEVEATDRSRAIEGYHITALGKEQGAEFGKRLGDVLTDHSSYLWDVAKNCEFLPGVAYRVHRGEKSCTVLICFSCDEVEVITGEGDSKHVFHEDIDPVRGQLVALAKEALPDDKTIQRLKD